MKISPSILAADLTDLKTIVTHMDSQVVDFLHMDVMDGHFVPTLSFGETYTKSLVKHTTIPLDVHLMVSNPEKEVPKYFEFQPYNITFHLETTDFPVRLSQTIRERGIKTGVAINPGTSESLLKPILDHVDLILLMTVEPGFYGQSFIESVNDKIESVSRMIEGRDIILEVDGGVTENNIATLYQKGVRMAVAGSACFKGGDVNDNVKKLKNAAVS